MKNTSGKRNLLRIALLGVLLVLLLGTGGQAAWKKTKSGTRYYVTKTKYVKGWKKISGKWYYFNTKGYLKKGWLKVGGKKYYLSKTSGARFTGLHKIGSKKYYFQSNGVMLVKKWKKINKKYYYFTSSGGMATSQWVGKYYVGADGARTKKTRSYGLVIENGRYYLYNKNFAKQKSWQVVDGKTYYFGTTYAALIGLYTIGGHDYYFGRDGAMVTGFQEIDGKTYYFGTDGAMVKNAQLTIDGVNYVFDENGVWNDADKGRAIAAYAMQFEGNPYVYGGTSLTNGADCSGFTQSVMAHFNIRIPRTAEDQRRGKDDYGGKFTASMAVTPTLAALLPGDLIFYYGVPSSHVALYIGDGQIIHASTEETGIIVAKYNYSKPTAARRYW